MEIMSISEVMDRALEVLKKYFKSYFIYNLVWGVLLIAMIIAFTIIAAIPIVFAVKASNYIIVGVIVALIVLVAIVVSLLPNLGIIKITQQEFSEEGVYAGDAIKITFKKLLPAAGVVVLEAILSIPLIALFIGAGYLVYKFQKNYVLYGVFDSTRVILGIIEIIVLFLLFIFLVLVYISIFAFTFQAMMIENTGIIKSIGRSIKLVKGDFWKIFGFIVLFLLAIYVLNIAIAALISLIIGAAYGVMSFLSFKQDFVVFFSVGITYLRWPISIVSNMILAPMFTIMMTMLYYNQRFKREGYNLILKLDRIERTQGEEEKGDAV